MLDEIAEFQGEYRFLSNFWPSPIRARDGITYPTLEHAFQAHKTKNVVHRLAISKLSSPQEAKRVGRTLELRPHWEAIKIDVMWNLLGLKFKPGTSLARALVRTHPAHLIEGNRWGDTFWGVCNGEGRNELGRLLMAQRDDLRERDA